jgi:hypothetical protein
MVSCVDRARGEKKSDECVGCYAMGLDDNISRSTKRALSVVVLTNFHEVEKTSQRKEGKTYTVLRQCEGRACDLCKQNVPRIFGARRWWSVGRNHFGQLAGFNETLGSHCACGGRLQRTGFECAKGHKILDVENSNLTDSQIEVFAQTPSKCRECDSEDIPAEILECSKECKSPERLDIFGVNMQIMTKGESTDSSVVLADWIADPIPDKYKGSKEPHDFDKILAPPPHGLVASRFNVENPFVGKEQATPHGGKAVDTQPEGGGEAVPYDETEGGEEKEEKEKEEKEEKEPATVGAGDGGADAGADAGDEDRYE